MDACPQRIAETGARGSGTFTSYEKEGTIPLNIWTGANLLRIDKVLNNNAALIKEDGREKIVMGPGIAFQKRKNDVIQKHKIEKIFVVHDENEKFKQVLETLPEEHIEAGQWYTEGLFHVLNRPAADLIFFFIKRLNFMKQSVMHLKAVLNPFDRKG